MDVIGHQHIRVKFALVLAAGFLEAMKEEKVITVSVEYWRPVISPDYGVLWIAGKDEAGLARHYLIPRP